MPRLSRKRIAKKSDDKKSTEDEKKKKRKRKLPKTLKECFECVDVGSIVLCASYLDIPPEPINSSNDEKSNGKRKKQKGQTKKEGPKIVTDAHEFGCIPWRLSLVHQLRKDDNGGYSKHILKLALHSDSRKDVAWRADVSGTLTMKKWVDKLPEGTDPSKLDEHSERFSTIFNQCCQTHAFGTEFPLPIGNSSAETADSVYLKNRQFKFELQFLLHNVEFSHTPKLDFHKNQQFCNVVIKIGEQRFYANKEYLSMYSPVFATMFTSQGFVESEQQEARLENASPAAFAEFLQLIYDPLRKPEGNSHLFSNLLELARRFVVQTITNRCEQQLLFMDIDDDDDAEHNSRQKISVENRMKLAEEYGLVWLKATLIVKCDVDKLLKMDGVIGESRQMLLRKKNVTAEEAEAKRKKEEEEKNAQKMEVDGKKQGTSSATAAAGGGRGTRGRGAGGRGAGRRGGVAPSIGRGRGRGAILEFPAQINIMNLEDFFHDLL
ncbi:hypothetical protein niasHT_010907 [Heterodera trifolii]|uniref:BTB domain-containing protein n=1 Tax=Heterodera trifolii TaxID=157864 RepID=A0ABD2LFU1_9BILA